MKASVALLFLMCGVAQLHAQAAQSVAVGLTEQEVLQRIGKPWSVRSTGNVKHLYYRNECRTQCPDDVVVLLNGRVTSATLSSTRLQALPPQVLGSVPVAPLPKAAAQNSASESAKGARGDNATAKRGGSEPRTSGDDEGPQTRPMSEQGERRTSTEPAQSAFRRVSMYAAVSGVYDSNLYHTEDEVQAQGLVAASGLRFQSSESRPALQLDYLAALHSYTQSDEWDRLSHHFRVVAGRRLSKAFEIEAVGEISLKGSSEDRDLGNQYVLSPRIEYRMNKVSRFRLTGAYRLKDLAAPTAPAEHNRYVELEFRQKFDDRRWDAGYRLETNLSESERRNYSRRTYSTSYATVLTRYDELGVEMKYRSQTYSGRIVEIEDTEVFRQDHRWIPSVSWTRRLSPSATAALQYQYETRSSNDPEKGYNAHLLIITMQHVLW